MELKKQLSLLDVLCIASGAMISSGIFILPGLAFSYPGSAVFISYCLAGVLPLVGVLSENKVARHAVISAQLFLINGNLVLSSERNFPKFWMASMN
jgi:amino acid transporter